MPPLKSFLRAGLLAMLFAAAAAPAAEATVSADVAEGKWKSVRLRNLPQGASLALQIESSGLIRVIVVDEAELRRFPATRALFEATVADRLLFRVAIPRSGDYYVIFDNRSGAQARQVSLRIQAEPPPGTRRETPGAGEERT